VNHHENNGRCLKCEEIFNKYPGFNEDLRSWFKIFQAKNKEAHISCAGRGRVDQEVARLAGKSRARYGESAHNYSAAIDVFVILPERSIYDKAWFMNVLAPEIPLFLNWYGKPNAPYPELPHVEIECWKMMKESGLLKLVE
jgi:hypothetical protein